MRFRSAPFTDLADGGRLLATALRELGPPLPQDAVILAVLPGGAVIGSVLVSELALPVGAIRVSRDNDGAVAEFLGVTAEQLQGRTLVVVDDGVESGTAANAAITLARSVPDATIVFAVPVCHAQAAADLAIRVDTLVAPRRPFTPRALRWEYRTFDPPADEAAALALLQPLGLT